MFVLDGKMSTAKEKAKRARIMKKLKGKHKVIKNIRRFIEKKGGDEKRRIWAQTLLDRSLLELTKLDLHHKTKELNNLEGLDDPSFQLIFAEMEADVKLAQLAESADNAYIVSQDSDYLLGYTQVKQVIRFHAGSWKLYEKTDVLKVFGLDTPRLLQFMACILGNDYSPGIQQIGQKTAARLVRKFNSDSVKDFLNFPATRKY